MALSLQKGGNLSLSKEDPSLRKICVGLGWDARDTDGAPFDLDASLFMVRADGRVRSDDDFIFYNQTRSKCGSVEHTGDNRTGAGDGDDESINVDLDLVPADIQRLIVAVTIFDADARKQNFGQVRGASVRLVNRETQAEVVRYDLTEEAGTETAMIFGEIYRYKDEWKFRAVGQGYSGGLLILARNHGVNL